MVTLVRLGWGDQAPCRGSLGLSVRCQCNFPAPFPALFPQRLHNALTFSQAHAGEVPDRSTSPECAGLPHRRPSVTALEALAHEGDMLITR